MGCDIHFFTEKFTSLNNYFGPRDISEQRNTKIDEIIGQPSHIKRWVSSDDWELHDGDWHPVEKYDGRNYYLFSVLADVRNSYVDPISYPKGIPDDASYGYKYMCDVWEGDSHSHSYFTLKELLEVDWDKYEKDSLSEFLSVLNELKSLDKEPENIRVCFFFDN